jgi:hypothetical protein
LLASGHLQTLHEQSVVPLDLVRCFPFNGLRRPPCATLLPLGRVRPKSSRCITSRTTCDFPVYQFGHGVTTLHVVALRSSSSFFCCRIRTYSGIVTSLLRTPELRAFLARATSAYSARLLFARCHATAAAPLARASLLPRATCSSAAIVCACSALPRTRSPYTPAPGATRVCAVRSHTPPRARSRRTCTALTFTSPYFNATRTAPAPARSRAPPHLLARQGLFAPCAYAQRLHCPRTRPTRSCPAPRPPPAPRLSRPCSVHHRAPAREPPRRACLRVLPACLRLLQATPATHLTRLGPARLGRFRIARAGTWCRPPAPLGPAHRLAPAAHACPAQPPPARRALHPRQHAAWAAAPCAPVLAAASARSLRWRPLPGSCVRHTGASSRSAAPPGPTSRALAPAEPLQLRQPHIRSAQRLAYCVWKRNREGGDKGD